MAAGPTRVANVIVPEIFTPYVQQRTMELSAIIAAGVLTNNALLAQLLGGGGTTFNVPSWNDLDTDPDFGDGVGLAADAARVSDDSDQTAITHRGIATSQEIARRLNRNQSWSSSDLAAQLAGSDPANAIGSRVGTYWARVLQRVFVAIWRGVLADNEANDGGDYVNDISGVYAAGVTDFSAEAVIDTQQTMGDAGENLAAIFMHSFVYARAKKNNLIDFVADAVNPNAARVPTFLGLRVIVDDGMPNGANFGGGGLGPGAGVYESWLFGAGATQFGQTSPKTPTETQRVPDAGQGAGEEQLYNRVQWALHPVGHADIGSGFVDGGFTNTEAQLATTWNRVYPERKMISFACLRTTEA